ncbi:hypothetical protein FOZ63_018058, partial [Perkinsus olseni]
YRAKVYIDRLRDRVAQLEEELERDVPGYVRSTETDEKKASEKPDHKPVRVFMDGAFDLMHYGHMNAFRTVIVVVGLGPGVLLGSAV